jgi:hypothetical protein
VPPESMFPVHIQMLGGYPDARRPVQMLGQPGLIGTESRTHRQRSDGFAAPVVHPSDD